MGWISELGGFWLTTLAWLAGLAVAFGVLVRLMPCNPGMYWWKDLRGAAADVMYWLVVPLLSRLCRTLLLIAGVVLLFRGRDPDLLPVRGLPLWQQCVAILLIQDVILYWVHRAFHTRPAWGFHAVHHSPKVLDWTAAVRFHPVNNLLEFGLADVAVLLMSFSPQALLVLAPFNVVYSAMVHANLNWTFGPLRYVFASPVFHRWHHTTLAVGRDKNFASTFPFLDVIFGTFSMPPGELPEQFGNDDPDYPEGFWGQLVRPFRKKERPVAALLTMGVLAGATLIGGGLYYRAWLANRAAQRAAEAEGAELAAAQAGAAPQVVRLDRAPRAWAGGNLVSASAIAAVAVSANGERVVAGDEGGTVKVWGNTPDREPLTLTGHRGRVSSVALSADGRRIVSGGIDKTVRLWDVTTGKAAQTLTGHAGPVLSVAVSADGGRIVSGAADGTVKVWDAATGREKITLTTDTDAVTGVGVSADGRRVVAANFKTAEVWDADTGRAEWTLAGHTDLVYSVAISPDGRRIVTGSFDGTAKVWDAGTGREERTLKGHTDSIYSVAITPDGKRVISGGNDRAVKVWDAQTGREELSLTGHADTVTGVAVGAEGERIVSGSRDGTVKVWDGRKSQQATASAGAT
ncbi:MAG TPA: sterol desaturase family protein [Gemmataceae bacterium]|nr:sterol desaturase family protein [Gemmataceae bacterium]